MLVLLTPECDVLDGLSHADQLVFQCLAKSTDYDTGVIGVSSPVSKWWVSDVVSEQIRGRAKGSWCRLSEKDVANSINRLIGAGLFLRLSDNKQLILKRVFWVEALSADDSVQNEVSPKLGSSLVSNISKLTYVFNRLDSSLSRGKSLNIDEVRPYHYKLINKYSDVKDFVMPLDYEFDMGWLKKIIGNSGVDVDLVKPEWLGLFKNYYNEKGSSHSVDFFHHKCAKQLCYWVDHAPELFKQKPSYKRASQYGSNVRQFVPAVNKGSSVAHVAKPVTDRADPLVVSEAMDDMYRSLGVERNRGGKL